MMQTRRVSIILLCASAILRGRALRISPNHVQMQMLVNDQYESSNGPWNLKGLSMLRELGFEPKNVLDIGANVGDWTREHMQLFPNAHFMMVDGWDHSDRWKDLLLSGRVESEVALLDETVHNVTWYATGATGDSIHKERTSVYSNNEGEVKQTQTLDELLLKRKLDTKEIGLLKMDVQGSELDVLRGAPKVLSDVEVILMELPFAGQYNRGAPSFAEYVSFLDASGFSPWDIPEHHRVNRVNGRSSIGNEGYLIQIDFVFLRKTSQYWNAVQAAISGIR